MKTRFRTRAFLLCFIPFTILLVGSFWIIQRFVQSTVRDGLYTSLREGQVAIASIHAKGSLQNSRFMKVAGENSGLKAGMELLLTNAHSDAARRTVEDQLRELGEHMGFDFLLVSAPNGVPLAGVVREGGAKSGGHEQLVPLDPAFLNRSQAGLLLLGGRTFQVASVPVDQNNENIGLLAVGEYFDFSDLTTLVGLMHNGKVVQSNLPRVSAGELEKALAGCTQQTECDLRLQGTSWISLPI